MGEPAREFDQEATIIDKARSNGSIGWWRKLMSKVPTDETSVHMSSDGQLLWPSIA